MINLGKDEHILVVTRKHWFVFFGQVIFIAILAIVPLIFFKIVKTFSILDIFYLPGNTTFIFVSLSAFWLLFLWIVFFVIWTNYYLDILVLTTKRIISIDQRGLFFRDVSDFRLDRIQDVTVEVRGILATLIKFGDIHIQTAGEDRDFMMRGVPMPYKLKETILNEHNKSVEEFRALTGHG